MNSTDFIQKKAAFFLLIIFAVSITPKVYFHDALVSHKDEPVCVEKANGFPHLHQPAFHCSQDDLVVTAPFLTSVQEFLVNRPLFFHQQDFLFCAPVLSSSFLHTEGRGPPAI